MEIDYPSAGQEAQLAELWQVSFGDAPEFVELFFESAFSPRRCRCVTERGRVTAALYWFDTEFEGQRLAYIYAVATHPDFQNRGLCRALMADTLKCLAGRGYDAALLMPQNEKLRQMYAKMGFRDCCTASAFSSTAGEPVPVRRVDDEEFARLRRKFLPRDGVIQEGENISYLARYASFYAGEDFLLAAVPEGGSLTGLELLGNAKAAPGILGALGYAQGSFRTPGKELPAAMFRPLKPGVKAPGYFGLVFD